MLRATQPSTLKVLEPTVERSYDVVASEYYDSILHPTCSNFRSASILLISEFLRSLPAAGRTLDLGAGRSVVPEVEAQSSRSLGSIVLFDGSRDMLANNESEFLVRCESIIGEPSKIPMVSEGIDLILSSLGDPYNNPSVWKECARLLTRFGRLIYTTPAYEWMLRYRVEEEGAPEHISRFVDRTGAVHDLPSFVYDPRTQSDLFGKAGLLVEETKVCYADEVPGPLSPKLVNCSKERLPIVRGFLLRRN